MAKPIESGTRVVDLLSNAIGIVQEAVASTLGLQYKVEWLDRQGYPELVYAANVMAVTEAEVGHTAQGGES